MAAAILAVSDAGIAKRLDAWREALSAAAMLTDVPNALAWGGIALLVAAGLGMLHSERQRARSALAAATD